VVGRLSRDQGFGFIRTQYGSELVFYASTLPAGVFDTLAEGQVLEYESDPDACGHHGALAKDVRLIDG
jgi:cold shock CspA family protein